MVLRGRWTVADGSQGTAVAVLGLRRAIRYAHDGQLLLAVAVTGCVAVAVSPTSWQHQLLWVLLAVVGRVGTRASDRYVWPVAVVLLMTLPARMMLPNMGVLEPLRDNLVLLAALGIGGVVGALFAPRVIRSIGLGKTLVVGMAITGVLFGGLALLLFLGFTWGALGAPLFGLALMAPIILANYLLWGRRLGRRTSLKEDR